MGYITDIYAGFSFASSCPYPDGSFADGLNRCDWSHQFSYETDPTQIPADQTNYRVVITEACFSAAELTEFMSNVQSGGEDIRVTLSDQTTEIPFAVVYIDKVAKRLELHARITGTTSSTVATGLKIYTGNVAASAYALNATYGQYNCFQDLEFYLTFRQDPSGGILTDLTGKFGNWTVQNMEAGDAVEQSNGMGAYTFDGIGGGEHILKLNNSLAANNQGAFTFMIDVNTLRASNGGQDLLGVGGSAAGGSGSDGRLRILKNRNAGFGDTDTHFALLFVRQGSVGAATQRSSAISAAIALDTYLVSLVSPGGGANYKWYLNGANQATTDWLGLGESELWLQELDTDTVGNMAFSVGDTYVGGAWGGFNTDDTIGPVFYESVAPSANLQLTRSNNYLTPGTFGQITSWVQS